MALTAETYAPALGLGDLSLREGKTTNQRVKGPLDLLDLPYDVVYSIFSKLCYHCQPRYVKIQDARIDQPRDAQVDRKGLWSLCLTSRAARRMAQPILFHYVFHSRNYARTTLVKLIRTLHEQPHLGHHVKMVELGSVRGFCFTHEPPFSLQKQWAEFILVVARGAGLDVSHRELRAYYSKEILVELLLVMLPSLVELRLLIFRIWDWRFRHLARWQKRTVWMNRRFLSSVKKMELVLSDTCPDRPSPVEKLLIKAAPNLETLYCTSAGLDGMPCLPQLHSLAVLEIWTGKGEVRRALKKLPSLKRFSYMTVWEIDIRSSDIFEALQDHEDTLEELSIRYNQFEYESWPHHPPQYSTLSLGGFTRLKNLHIDQSLIWPRGDSPAKVTTFLPQNLETLFLDCVSFGHDVEDEAVFGLAEAIRQGGFKNLPRVHWADERAWDGNTYNVIDFEDKTGEGWVAENNWSQNLGRACRFETCRRRDMVFPYWG
ncbi:hypothetical protein FDECE_10126 [Fusarium decemcellulare]|nr:hypothetical protein FDECE_10126 [Fusarium decemcellulare]